MALSSRIITNLESTQARNKQITQMSVAESSSHDSDRQNLLSRLLDATKECQLRFGGKGELATENDSRVSVLCAAWENCLKHGIKSSNRALAALKQVSELTGLSKIKAGFLGDINDIETEPVFWHAIRETLNKHDLERYTLLKHITNDTGRGRAWLRSCLNEKTLEKQVNALKSNTKVLSQFYEDWALVRDEQRFALLANTASGLASVLFAITIDSEDFNQISAPPTSSSQPIKSSISASGFGKLISSSLLNTFQRPADLRQASAANSIAIPELKSNVRNQKAAKLVSFDDVDSDDEETGQGETSPSSSSNLNRSSSKASIGSTGSVALTYEEDTNSASFTPLSPLGTPIDIEDDDTKSYDSDIPTISCSWHEDSAHALSLAAKSRSDSYLRTQGDGSSLPEEQPRTAETMSTGELKQAIVTMMVKKDETEEQNRTLKAVVEQEMEYTKSLRAQLEEVNKRYEEELKREQGKVQSLTKDNELLKHQLKKYITAVQRLRRDGPNAENLEIHLEAPLPTITPSQLTETSSQEAMEYKRQIIQVAEMHGELMEFNEHLHKQLLQKEFTIQKLTGELTELRGPLPSDINSILQDSYGVVDSSDWRPLVNIWVPSVFLKGSQGASHHVYQVFLRIKDDEWNVYRRYSDLHSFYRKLKKKYPLVYSFGFPPKKSVGNKDTHFVEDRRKRLQTFLRKAIQHIVSTDSAVASDLSRTKLTELFPILGEPKAKKKSKGGRSQSPSRAASSSQQYTGL